MIFLCNLYCLLFGQHFTALLLIITLLLITAFFIHKKSLALSCTTPRFQWLSIHCQRSKTTKITEPEIKPNIPVFGILLEPLFEALQAAGTGGHSQLRRPTFVLCDERLGSRLDRTDNTPLSLSHTGPAYISLCCTHCS